MNTTNTKYAIGDYVLVSNNLVIGNAYKMTNNPDVTQTFTDEMAELRNCIVRICDFSEDGNAYLVEHPTIEDEGTVWTDEMFIGSVSKRTGEESFITDLLELTHDMTSQALCNIRAESDKDLTAEFTSIIYAAKELSKLTGIVVEA